MASRHYSEKFADYLNDSLNEAEKELVNLHLAGCAECRKELEMLRQYWQVLHSFEKPAFNPYFYSRLQARMHRNADRSSYGFQPRLRRSLVYLTLIVTGLITGIYLGKPSGNEDETLRSAFEKAYHLDDEMILTQNMESYED